MQSIPLRQTGAGCSVRIQVEISRAPIIPDRLCYKNDIGDDGRRNTMRSNIIYVIVDTK